MLHEMSNKQWLELFRICRTVLGTGDQLPMRSESWCSWTTFSRLNEDAKYWAAGVPNIEELTESGIQDGGIWGQPFSFNEIAHLIIPQKFYWESSCNQTFNSGFKSQDIKLLSHTLTAHELPHRITDLVLEVKCY